MKRLLGVLLVLGLCVPILATTAQVPTKTTVPAIAANSSAAAPIQAAQGNPDIKVCVNTNSGVYHCPDTRWYGNTKHGEYMTQREAQKKGYRPAYGEVCR